MGGSKVHWIMCPQCFGNKPGNVLDPAAVQFGRLVDVEACWRGDRMLGEPPSTHGQQVC